MTAMKEQAVQIIDRLPDERMPQIIIILENLASLTGTGRPKKGKMKNLLAAAGKIDIDGEAVEELRRESII